MDLRGYLNALRKSWLVIVGLAVLGAVAAYLAFSLTTPSYTDSVTFYVSTPVNQNENAQAAGQFAQNRITSYVQLLESDRLGQAVAQDTGLPVADIDGKIIASAQASTVLVTATVTDTSPSRAAQIANGVAVAFPSLVNVLDNSGRQSDVVKVSVTSGPTASAGPVAPSLRLYAAIGIGAGLVLGVIVAVVRALLDQSVRTGETAAALVGVPLIGSIVADPAAKRSPLIVGEEATSIRAEEFRQLRTSLRFIDAAGRTDVLLITSAAAQEGKSMLSVNLAISLAEDGQRVLLIDGDLRRPSAAALLGLDGQLGVTDLLIGQAQSADAIQVWGPNELHVLASGPVPPNPAELLGSDRMAELVDELRGQYDKIIIDSPPVLPVADAAVIATLADGVLFVVRYGKTPRGRVRSAAQSLSDVGGRLVGTVLNLRKESSSNLAQYAYISVRTAGAAAKSAPPEAKSSANSVQTPTGSATPAGTE